MPAHTQTHPLSLCTPLADYLFPFPTSREKKVEVVHPLAMLRGMSSASLEITLDYKTVHLVKAPQP